MSALAVVGRTFSSSDEKLGAPPTAVIGYDLSQRLFGLAAQSIGKSIRLNGVTFTVIGVMPPVFDFPFERRPGFRRRSSRTPPPGRLITTTSWAA